MKRTLLILFAMLALATGQAQTYKERAPAGATTGTSTAVQKGDGAGGLTPATSTDIASLLSGGTGTLTLTGYTTGLAPIASPAFTGTVKFPDGVVTQASTGQSIFGTSSNALYLYSGTNGLIVNNQGNTATLLSLTNAGALTLGGAASFGSLNITAATNPALNYGGSLFLTRSAAGTVSVGSTLGGTDGTVLAANAVLSNAITAPSYKFSTSDGGTSITYGGGTVLFSVGGSNTLFLQPGYFDLGISMLRFGSGAANSPQDVALQRTSTNTLTLSGNLTASGSITENGTTASIPGVLKTTSVNASTVGNTALYTVPTGKTCVVTGYIVRVTAATAITNGPAAGVGNASGTNNIAASQAMNGLTSTATTGSASEFSWPIVGMTTVTPAGGTIYFNLGTAATGTSETVAVDLIGYIY